MKGGWDPMAMAPIRPAQALVEPPFALKTLAEIDRPLLRGSGERVPAEPIGNRCASPYPTERRCGGIQTLAAEGPPTGARQSLCVLIRPGAGAGLAQLAQL